MVDEVQEEEKTFEQEIQDHKKEEEGDTVLEDDIEKPTDDVEEIQDDAEDTEESAEEIDKQQKAQDAYRERQRKKQEARQAELTQQAQQVQYTPETPLKEEAKLTSDIEAKFAAMDEIIYQQQYDQTFKVAERELTNLEGDFKVAFTDYDDVVNAALDLSRMRMVSGGMSELQANIELNREKVLLADNAARLGKDPVEAVYKEAKAINSVFDNFAEKNGYVKKGGKPKTNLAAMREASKPNAMTGGRGASAVTKSFDDLEIEEVGELTMADMLNGNM